MLIKGKDTVAISLSDEVLKIAELKGSGPGAKLINAIAVDVRGQSDQDLQKTVRSAISSVNTKSSQVLALAPVNAVTVKNIEVPSTDPTEIQSIVNLQAGRHTPFSRDEIQVGYITVGESKENFTKVLLVIANRTILKKYMAIYESCGLKIKDVLFAPENIASFYGGVAESSQQSSVVGIIDIGKYATDFIIARAGRVLAQRNIPVGKSQLSSEGESAKSKLTDELKKTVDSYHTEDAGEMPASFLMSQDDFPSQEIASEIQTELGWSIDTLSYIEQFKPSKKALQNIKEDHGDCSFLDVVSSAAMGSESSVNLLPDEVQIQKNIEDQSRETLKTAILGVVVIFLIAAAFGLKLYFNNMYYNKMVAKYSSTREKVIKLEKMSDKNQQIKKYMNTRMASLEVIRELYKTMPKEIYLTNINMLEDGQVDIKGISDIGSSVYNLNTTLKEIDLFDNAEVASKSAKKDRGKDVHAFEISLILKNSEAKLKETEEK